MYSWQFATESTMESSITDYTISRLAPPVWLAMAVGAWFFGTGSGIFWLSAVPGTIATCLAVTGTYHVYRYMAYVKVTPDGLVVRKGKKSRVQPWESIAKVQRVPLAKDLWRVTFAYGSPAVEFRIKGFTATSLLGLVRSDPALVAEIRKRVAAASSATVTGGSGAS